LLGALGVFAAIATTRRRSDAVSARYVTAEITRGALEVTITATGTVEALRTVQVGSEVSGRLQRVLVEANDRVSKGQLLAVIDPEQLRATVNEGQAQVQANEAVVRQARATLAEAQAAAARARKQAAEGLAAQKDLESALATAVRSEAAVHSALANVALARATLAAAQTKLDRATVVSPIDGVVLSRQVEVGQTVTAGFTTPVMFTIAEDLGQMRLEVDIDEADVGRAKEGQRASFTVEAYPERLFPSRLIALRYNPTTSSNVVTYKAVLSADNQALLLRPGMTATATIITDIRPSVLLVPNAALRFAPPKPSGPGAPPESASPTPARGERSVFVLDGPRLRRIAVKVGASDGVRSELLADTLPVGSRVVVDLQGGS
jgi:HlyD family secretion protein